MYKTVIEPPKNSKYSWQARALFNSVDRRIDTLPNRHSLSDGITQEFINSLNKHMKQVDKIVKDNDLYDLYSWDKSHTKWQVLIDTDIKIAVQTDLNGYMYLHAWSE